MAIEVDVTVNGVSYPIVRADAWLDEIGAGNAPAPGGKALTLPPPESSKGSAKFYGGRPVKLALNPDHPAYHAAVHRATYYPADQATLTAVSRKKPSLANSAHGKTERIGRGKVGVGGIRTKSHG